MAEINGQQYVKVGDICEYIASPIEGSNYTWSVEGAEILQGDNACHVSLRWINPGLNQLTVSFDLEGITQQAQIIVVTDPEEHTV